MYFILFETVMVMVKFKGFDYNDIYEHVMRVIEHVSCSSLGCRVMLGLKVVNVTLTLYCRK